MKTRNALALLYLFTVPLFCVYADEPVRQKGVSAHMLPKRVADLGGIGAWGFQIDLNPLLKPEVERPVLQTPEGLLQYVRKQIPEVISNGVWIVTTHPTAYSDQEKKLFDDVKTQLPKQGIRLFICRGSDLPNGWAEIKAEDKDSTQQAGPGYPPQGVGSPDP